VTLQARRRSLYSRKIWKDAPVGSAWEHLIAVDEISERHRLSPQRADDVPVVDDMPPLLSETGRPRLKIATGVMPMKQCDGLLCFPPPSAASRTIRAR
jgi:hypothetical protein